MRCHAAVEELIKLYEAGYNDASLVCCLEQHMKPKDDALKAAESFIVGFEGDELQEGIPALLNQIRRAK